MNVSAKACPGPHKDEFPLQFRDMMLASGVYEVKGYSDRRLIHDGNGGLYHVYIRGALPAFIVVGPNHKWGDGSYSFRRYDGTVTVTFGG